jgi:hypothetical protein
MKDYSEEASMASRLPVFETARPFLPALPNGASWLFHVKKFILDWDRKRYIVVTSTRAKDELQQKNRSFKGR